jgi:hypothetical protein
MNAGLISSRDLRNEVNDITLSHFSPSSWAPATEHNLAEVDSKELQSTHWKPGQT